MVTVTGSQKRFPRGRLGRRARRPRETGPVVPHPGRPAGAAISVHDGDHHLQDLSLAIRQASLDPEETNRLLIRAWEAAVQSALVDGLVSLDEESALAKYASHFSLTQQDLDGNGAQTSLVQAAVIRDVTQGIVPSGRTSPAPSPST